AGRTIDQRTLDVDVPAGIHDGQRIRISGEGHAGLPGGDAGDVYVLVRVKPDERFVREGDDIFSQVDLTMTEAALGARVTVPTLDGEAELEFEPGTQPGEVHVLNRKGMPVLHGRGRGRGDHRVLVNVLVPRKLDDSQRKLLEDFASSADEQTYAAEDGFFHRLKSAFR
ncbi:MAG TPA: DnaJ C-terminal domain-containing protein, partial [Gaiellaceae bacterium]|nr:DnaJ C-terminal domain-containing protein [Gaiellaceae bacterium]